MADLLWLPPEAQIQPDRTQPLLVRNGRSVYVDGSAAVYFTIDMDCDDLAARVLTQAGAARWHRRSTPVDNPNQGLPAGNRCLQSAGDIGWAGEWDDARGNVIRYAFGGSGRQLRGEAGFRPHDLVVQANTRPRP